MKRVLYHKYSYIVFQAYNSLVVWNRNKEFKEGHAHLSSVQAAIDAVNFSLQARVPMKANVHYLDTLIRISSSKEYLERLNRRKQEIIEERRSNNSNDKNC